MKFKMLSFSMLFIFGAVAFAQDNQSAMMNHEHKMEMPGGGLTEAGE